MNITDNRFQLEIGEPVLVGQKATAAWGHYQFPHLSRTTNGDILYTWSTHDDDITYTQSFNWAVSEDGGATWRERRKSDVRVYPHALGNGKNFAGFHTQGGYKAEYIEKYAPAFTVPNGPFGANGEKKIYDAEDIPEFDRTMDADEWDPVTGEISSFDVKVNWPHMAVAEYPGNILYPARMTMAIVNDTGMLKLDDGLYYCTYGGGFDAVTGQPVPFRECSSVYVFRSADCGRTWNLLSQITVNDETFAEHPFFEGFTEPMMTRTPDGSVVMLIRTGSHMPCFITRSTDRCRTWSTPVWFDECGVLPQLLTLKCGVTLASYGRAPLFVRATGDPAGLDWQPHQRIVTSKRGYSSSCGYTSLLELDDHTALLAYSDFNYPGPDGEPTKALIARRLTVKPLSE